MYVCLLVIAAFLYAFMIIMCIFMSLIKLTLTRVFV